MAVCSSVCSIELRQSMKHLLNRPFVRDILSETISEDFVFFSALSLGLEKAPFVPRLQVGINYGLRGIACHIRVGTYVRNVYMSAFVLVYCNICILVYMSAFVLVYL